MIWFDFPEIYPDISIISSNFQISVFSAIFDVLLIYNILIFFRIFVNFFWNFRFHIFKYFKYFFDKKLVASWFQLKVYSAHEVGLNVLSLVFCILQLTLIGIWKNYVLNRHNSPNTKDKSFVCSTIFCPQIPLGALHTIKASFYVWRLLALGCNALPNFESILT